MHRLRSTSAPPLRRAARDVGGMWLTAAAPAVLPNIRERAGRYVANTIGGAPPPIGARPGDPNSLLNPEQRWLIYERTPDVRSAVDQIVRRIATWPWVLNVNIPTSDPRYQPAMARVKTTSAFLKTPNEDGDTWQEILTSTITDLLVHESGACEIAFDKLVEVPAPWCPAGRAMVPPPGAKILEIVSMNGASLVKVVDNHGRTRGYYQSLYPVFGATLLSITNNGDASASPGLGKKQVLQFRLFPNTVGRITPLIDTLIIEIGAILASSEHLRLAMDSDEIPPGVLVLTGIANKAAEEAKKDFQRQRNQDHKIRVISTPDPRGGGAHWVELRRTPKDLAMLDVVRQIRRTIWRVFGVQPVEMGDTEDLPRAVGEVQLSVGTSHLIKPILNMIQEKINARVIPLLVGEFAGLIEFAFDQEVSLSATEQESKSRAITALVDRGVININEARQELDREPIEGGDINTITVQGGVMPVAALNSLNGAEPEEEDAEEAEADGSGATGPGDVKPPSKPSNAKPPAEDTPDADDAPGRRVALRLPPAPPADVRVTDFPRAGEDLEVSLRNSRYAVFDPEYAENIRQQHPRIWGRGGNTRGSAVYKILRPIALRGGMPNTEEEEDTIFERESWGARHRRDHLLAGVVAQIKWLVVGDQGEAAMKDLINEEIRRLFDEDARSASLVLDLPHRAASIPETPAPPSAGILAVPTPDSPPQQERLPGTPDLEDLHIERPPEQAPYPATDLPDTDDDTDDDTPAR